MSDRRYRLALGVTLEEMPDIANALADDFPALAKAVEAQWLEILNSGLNVFGDYEQNAAEAIAGMTLSKIELIGGVSD